MFLCRILRGKAKVNLTGMLPDSTELFDLEREDLLLIMSVHLHSLSFYLLKRKKTGSIYLKANQHAALLCSDCVIFSTLVLKLQPQNCK